MKVIYIFTNYFPYGDESMSEHVFLKNEIKHLNTKFDKVVVVPSLLLPPLPQEKKFEVDDSLGNMLKGASKLKIFSLALTNQTFYREIISKSYSFWNLEKLKRLLYFTGRAELVKRWIERRLNKTIFTNNALFYTYWLTEVTLGLVAVKSTHVISRAHGYDLYEENTGYIPCQNTIIKKLDALYLVCEYAKNYLTSKYPDMAQKLNVAYLGVEKASNIPNRPISDILHVVSCAYLKPLKRVHLIYYGLLQYIEKYNKLVHWTHFGDGPEMDRIKKLSSSTADTRFQCELRAKTLNREILIYYSTMPVDIFILLSKSEGLPVTLQEASAHGIPVIATKVGGVPEIVNNDVGVLLNEDPTAEEVAEAIHYVVSDSARFHRMQRNSLLNWEANFNENKNYQIFSRDLIKLLS